MSLSIDDLRFLASTDGERLLERLRGENLRESNALKLLTALRKDHPADQARAALELAQVRVKAADKFGADAYRMFFTREALEQASHPLVRRYRARWTRGERVLDVCCGIGADSLAFAGFAADVIGIDIDPVRVEAARLNAAVLGLHNVRFEVVDAHSDLSAFLQDRSYLFYDPARRDDDGRRIYDIEAYTPPLSLIERWRVLRRFAKLSPGVNLGQVARYGGYLEFISVEGDLKEAFLGLFDVPATEPPRLQTVLLLPDGKSLGWGTSEVPKPLRLDQPRAWLIEPDPGLIRAGLVRDAAAIWEGAQLDESIAYITAEVKPDTPWARSWRVRDWMPFNGKKLRAYLRERGIGTVTVKKRGTALTPEILIPQLKLSGDASCTLVLTRHQGKQIVIVCDDY